RVFHVLFILHRAADAHAHDNLRNPRQCKPILATQLLTQGGQDLVLKPLFQTRHWRNRRACILLSFILLCFFSHGLQPSTRGTRSSRRSGSISLTSYSRGRLSPGRSRRRRPRTSCRIAPSLRPPRSGRPVGSA